MKRRCTRVCLCSHSWTSGLLWVRTCPAPHAGDRVDNADNQPKKDQKFLVTVVGAAAACHLPGGHVQSGYQGGGSVPDIGCVRRSSWPGRIGKTGWVRCSVWIWDVSSMHSTPTFSGGWK